MKPTPGNTQSRRDDDSSEVAEMGSLRKNGSSAPLMWNSEDSRSTRGLITFKVDLG